MKISRRYQTHPVIRDEMLKLIKWARDNDMQYETPEKKLEAYLNERDIAISAQGVGVIENVSKKDSLKETVWTTVLVIGVVVIAVSIGIAIQIWK